MAAKKDKKEYEKLVLDLNAHAYRYYVLDDPTISDREYDRLFARLQEIEQAHPDWIRPDSPTQRVAPAPRTELRKVTRSVKMGSLDNTYEEQDLKEFHRRVTEGLPSTARNPAYVVEPKIDGVSLELIYRGGALALATTRGDGTVGEDVTENARTVKMIPLSVKERGELVVRGEVFINQKDLDRVNRQRKESGEEEFANPRNAAAGSLRMLDARVVARRPLRFFVWDLVGGENRFKRHSKALDWLASLGLPVHGRHRKCATFDEVLEAIASLRKDRDSLPYLIDGAVVKVDDYGQRAILGETARFPRWAVAYKYEAEKAVTRLVDIQLGMGRTGVLTPVASLEPVRLSGTTVTNASLHNVDLIREKDVRIGDLVEVEKAGEIIPYVIRALHEKRSGSEKIWSMPGRCPFCGSKIERKEGEAAVRCSNRACPEQVRARIFYFTRRGAMDIDRLGKSLIQQLTDKKLVRDPADLYGLRKEDLIPLERMAEKSAANVIEAIEASRTGRGFDRLVLALGILHVGEVAAGQIARLYPDMKALLGAAPADVEATLSEVSGIGPVIAASLKEFLEDGENRALLKKLIDAGVRTVPLSTEKAAAVGGPLRGLSFCVTGVLSLPRAKVQERIRAAGGEVHDAVKQGTRYLVAGEKVGAMKLSKAKKYGTEVIDEARLHAMLKK